MRRITHCPLRFDQAGHRGFHAKAIPFLLDEPLIFPQFSNTQSTLLSDSLVAKAAVTRSTLLEEFYVQEPSSSVSIELGKCHGWRFEAPRPDETSMLNRERCCRGAFLLGLPVSSNAMPYRSQRDEVPPGGAASGESVIGFKESLSSLSPSDGELQTFARALDGHTQNVHAYIRVVRGKAWL